MYEKVSPMHPDKLADRIAGALVDRAYQNDQTPKIAVEVLLGHGTCTVIAETSVHAEIDDVRAIVKRIAGISDVRYIEVPQDAHLADNQNGAVRCGDNGIFKGVPLTAAPADPPSARMVRPSVAIWIRSPSSASATAS